jgi:replicative DNA helicase
MSETISQLPPHSPDAERSILGSMIRQNERIGDVLETIDAEDFYADAHQKIFRAIVGLYDKGSPVDLVVLSEVLKEQKQIEDIGGYPYLALLWDAAPTAANVEYYARIVRDKALTRNVIHVTNEIQRDAYEQAGPTDQLLEGAEQKIFAIAERKITGNVYSAQQIVHEVYDAIDAWQNDPQAGGLSTSLPDLDALIGGFRETELVIVAARPGHGKTALALQFARHAVTEQGAPVLFVSLEQRRIELFKRIMCGMAKVDGHKVRRGKLTNDEIQQLLQVGNDLLSRPLFVADEPQQSMLRIAANARRLKSRKGIRLVIVDYLGLIDAGAYKPKAAAFRNRQEEVANMSRRLKCLARELELPVVCLAQLNRGPEDRKDHRPRLSDLRESGAMEQDADIVMLLHRPDAYDPNDRPGQLDIIVAKQRDGPERDVRVFFHGKHFSFETLDPFAVATDPHFTRNGSAQ